MRLWHRGQARDPNDAPQYAQSVAVGSPVGAEQL
jgi:hypothetical protein